MPFGTLTIQSRLGIANASVPNSTDFATTVLQLLPVCPIYQQQIANTGSQGPQQPGEWDCGTPDATLGVSRVLRQVSPHHFTFGRMNVTKNNKPFFNYRFNDYIAAQSNQLFYVCNEPEVGISTRVGAFCQANCYAPNSWERDLDTLCMPDAEFWQYNAADSELACATGTDPRRIKPKALAKMFLRLKRRAESLGRGHVVLPPAIADPRFNVVVDNVVQDPDPDNTAQSYWRGFFNAVHNPGGAGGNCAEPYLPVNERLNGLTALHGHAYTTYLPRTPPTDPIATAADVAIRIRQGVKWYKDTYAAGLANLPLDYMLSEFGPAVSIRDTAPWRRWYGGLPDMRLGLSFWNTLLAWITRSAPTNLGLENGRTLYAAIHEPDFPPYVARNPSLTTRRQWYFNLDAWATYSWDVAPAYEPEPPPAPNDPNPPQPVPDTSRYRRRFTCLRPTLWQGESWYLSPFGLCYATWAEVANDINTTTFGQGFVYDGGAANVVMRTTLPISAGWSTICIPFIKNTGAFGSTQTLYNVRWNRGDIYPTHGSLDFSSPVFPDSKTVTGSGNLTLNTMSAMVLPLIVSSGSARAITLEVIRSRSGPGIFVGRPVVFDGVGCSWSEYH